MNDPRWLDVYASKSDVVEPGGIRKEPEFIYEVSIFDNLQMKKILQKAQVTAHGLGVIMTQMTSLTPQETKGIIDTLNEFGNVSYQAKSDDILQYNFWAVKI